MRKPLTVALASLFLGLAFDILFFEHVPGISVFIYSALILGLTIGMGLWFRKKLNPAVYWLIPVTLFFAIMIFVRTNPFLIFVDVLLITYLLIMVAHLSHQPKLKLWQFELPDYISKAVWMPMTVLQHFFKYISNAAQNRDTVKSNSSLIPIVRGIIISLPVLIIFLLLLSSADLVFKEFITSIFNPNLSPETVFQICLVGFISSVFLGAFAYIFLTEPTPVANSKDPIRFALGTTEAAVILGSVAALFLMFVLIQVAYLFGGSDHIVSTGHTYAEYARKGFFELIAVAAISLGLILAVKRTVKPSTVLHNVVFKWLSGVLIIEVLVIMLSAHMRLNLYEEAYGFTTLRLWSHIFILWLAVAFGLLMIHIVREVREQKFAYYLFISGLCFFGLINLINPDAFIARKNIDRFHETGKLDVSYLNTLSEDATPAISTLLDDKNEQVRQSAAAILSIQKSSADDLDNGWQSANVARNRADQIYEKNSSQLKDSSSENVYLELDVQD